MSDSCICLGFSRNKMCPQHGNPAKHIAMETAKAIGDLYELKAKLTAKDKQIAELVCALGNVQEMYYDLIHADVNRQVTEILKKHSKGASDEK